MEHLLQQYPSNRYSFESAFEVAHSGGAEQNTVSICIMTLREATFFNRWSGADGEKSNQINSLQLRIEELKL